MAVDERRWRALYDRLQEVLGVESADALMEHLPPSDWNELATKHDIEILRTEMTGLRYELLAALHKEVNEAMISQTRMVIFTMAGTIALLGGLVIGILGLE